MADAETISVTLSRPEMPAGLGFSLLSIADCPPVIYDIIENTPAAECAQVPRAVLLLSPACTSYHFRFGRRTRASTVFRRLSCDALADRLRFSAPSRYYTVRPCTAYVPIERLPIIGNVRDGRSKSLVIDDLTLSSSCRFYLYKHCA